MKNGKLSIGLIGAGRAGMIHARNLRASVPHAALTAVADPGGGGGAGRLRGAGAGAL